MRLVELPRVDNTSVMEDVDRTYSGRSSNERLLLVIFDSADATVQLTGGDHRSPGWDVDVLVRRNAVVLYQHEGGTISRLGQVRTALDRTANAG